MGDIRPSKFRNELTRYLQQCQNVTPPVLNEESDLVDATLRVCSGLADRHTRLTLIDNLLRRKSVLPSDATTYAKVFCYVSSELLPLACFCSTENMSFDADLCLCLHMLTYFLSKAASTPEVIQSLKALLPCMASVLRLTSMDSMLSSFTFLIQIFRFEDSNAYAHSILKVLQESNVPPVQRMQSYFDLLRQLLCDGNFQARRLVIIYAVLGSLSVEQWTDSPTDSSYLPLSLLTQAFLHYTNTNLPVSSMDTTDLYFLAKIGQTWSSRYSTMSLQLKGREDGQVPGIGLKQPPVSDLLRFSLEMKSSSVSVVRHCCLETFENLLRAHLTCCNVCCSSSGSGCCDVVSEILFHTGRSSWLLRGTLNVLTRLVELIFQRTKYSVSWLLDCFVEDNHSEDRQESSSAFVASRLLMCAADPSLAIYVAELYVLIANRLLITNASLLRSWLKPLVTLAGQDYETYGASINQYVLPKLASVDLSLLSEMIETINESQPNACTSLLFGCYRLALRAGQNGRKRFSFGLPSCYSLLRRILTCHDIQARADALEFLRTATQECKDSNELMQLVDIFFSFLRVNLWEPQRSARQQISYVTYVVAKALLGRFLKAKAKNTLDSTGTLTTFEPRDRLLPLTALLLQGLYPGVPAARMSLSLSGLYNLAIALKESVGENHKANDYTLGLFCRAARLSLDIGFSDMKDDSCEFALNSAGIKQFSSRLFVGLCSPYEEDREYALQICLSTGLASKMAPGLISRLWRESLTVFATSARPDVSPLAWQFIRLAINAVPESPVDENTSTLENSKDDPLLQLDLTTPPRERLLLAVSCLLNSIETQLHSAETVPVEGLLAVAASKPFYAMLSAVRSILSNSTSEVTQSCDKSNQGKVIQVRRVGKHRVDCVDVSVDAEQLFGRLSDATSIADRIIGLALRISGLLLPILSTAAPEGHLPGAEDGMGVTFDPMEHLDPDVLSDASETRKFPEYLTVCCWRSVRELSILLGVCLPQIAGLMPVHTPSTSIKPSSASGLKLSDDQILKISQFFCTQLLCGRHRGALEQCSIGFACFCSSLLSTKETKLKRLPSIWLDVVLLDLLNEYDSVDKEELDDFVRRARMIPLSSVRRNGGGYCSTRRSAGLPFFIQSILATIWGTPSADRDVICTSITRLLNLVDKTLHGSSSSSCSFDLVERCVVVLNVARALFRATGLAQPTSQFVERATCLVLDGMGSAEWSIRNSSGLLYGALVERIFGGNRSREAANRKNCLTSASFFARYPSLKQQLLRVFEETSDNLISPALAQMKQYASLFLLTRLLPPHQSCTASGLVESTFGPFVLRCAASCSIRIRTLAARAVSCLIHADRLPVVVEAYIGHLERLTAACGPYPSARSNCNFIHGLLLQLRQLFSLDFWPVQPRSPRSSLLLKLAKDLSCLADPIATPCPLIRKTFMSIVQTQLHLDMNVPHSEPPGLGIEASELRLRLIVTGCLSALREEGVSHLPETQSLLSILRQTTSSECQASVLRETLFFLTESPQTFATHLYDLGPKDLTIVYSRSGALDPEFGDCVVKWIGLIDLVEFLRVLPMTVIANHMVVRYGLSLLTVLLPFASVDTNKSIITMFQWMASCFTSKDVYYGLYSPFIYYLAAVFRKKTRSPSELDQLSDRSFACALTNLLEQFTGDVLRRDDFFDDEVREAFVNAIGELFVFAQNFRYTESIRLFQFLLESLLNFNHPELQKVACKNCLRFLETSRTDDLTSQNTNITPLPYVVLPLLIKHVLEHGLLQVSQLIAVTQALFVPVSSSANHSPQESQQRVFAHNDPQCLTDMIAIFSTVTRTIGGLKTLTSNPSSKESLYLAARKQIAAVFERVHGEWLYDPKLTTEPIEVRRLFELTCLDAFTRYLGTLTDCD
ncbi:hypothetical protein CRM22_007311 [Opisthorchis felineus]|uniref:tRNA (32-2'-O)-methyltransferase regulator THADA n=1 Tax=Opisthorchis felineus TaxID=147828 RepID=A0A4S2LPQ4_OPIFE|nr:hypothetical protein CRM22_007311 [Opisthorchis felineus]